MRALQLTVVIGQYQMAYHLPHATGSLTDTVRAWRDAYPSVVPLPHPSPRNNMWLKRNPWFAAEVVPALRARPNRSAFTAVLQAGQPFDMRARCFMRWRRIVRGCAAGRNAQVRPRRAAVRMCDIHDLSHVIAHMRQ